MPKDHHHLTRPERCRIYALGKSGLSRGAVARRPGRCPSVMSREIRRNGGERGYRHARAQRRAKVTERLEEGWSPERISGRLAAGGPGDDR